MVFMLVVSFESSLFNIYRGRDWDKYGGGSCLAVIVGHSYVRQLWVYAVDNNIPNLRLDREQFSVEIRGKGGLCLKHLHHDATIVQFQQALAICFLQLGENDIVNGSVA